MLSHQYLVFGWPNETRKESSFSFYFYYWILKFIKTILAFNSKSVPGLRHLMGLFQFTAILVVKLHFFFKVIGWLRAGVLQVWKQSQIINQFRPAKRSLESEIWVTEIYLQRVHISKGGRWRQKKPGRPYINWLLCTVWSREIVLVAYPPLNIWGPPLKFID